MDMSLVSAGDDIKLWDCTNFVQQKQFNPHNQNINTVCWASDNSFLASVSVHTEDVVLTYMKDYETLSLPTSGGCLCVDLHDTSRYMLVTGSDGLISVWDLKSKKKRKTYKGHKGPVTSARFNKGSSYIASGSESGEIILHNVVTGQGCQPLTASNIQAIKQVQYSLHKKSLLGSVSDDGSVNLWDCNKQQMVQSFNCHQAPATGLSFSPINDIFLMSVGLDKRIACHDLQTKKVVKIMNAESPLTSIDTKSDGITVVVGSTRGKIYQYDLRMASVPVRTVEAHRSSVQCLQFQKEVVEVASNKTGGVANKQQLKHRQLPVSPKSNLTPRDVSGPAIDLKTPSSGVMDDIFSPLREGYQDQSSEEMDYNASGSFTKNLHILSKNSAGEGYAGGVFSPVNENVGLSTSSTGVSPLAMSSYPNENRNSSGMPEYNRPDYQYTPVGESNQRRRFDQYKLSDSNHTNNNTQQKQVTFLSDDPDPYAFLTNGSSSSNSDTASPELKRPRSTNQHQVGMSASPSFPSMPLGDSPGSVTGSSSGAVRHFHATTPDGVNAQSSIVNSLNEYNHEHRNEQRYVDTHELHNEQRHVNKPDRNHHHSIPSDMKQFAEIVRTVVQEEMNSYKCEMKHVVRDEIEDMRDQLHRDIINLQTEMLRQFQIHQSEMMTLLDHYSVNKDLVCEVEKLQDELKRLKKNF